MPHRGCQPRTAADVALVTHGLNYPDSFRQVITQNHLDSFLNLLLDWEKHANKVVELDNVQFIAAKGWAAQANHLLCPLLLETPRREKDRERYCLF